MNPFGAAAASAGTKMSTINSDINVVVNDKPVKINPLHEQWLINRRDQRQGRFQTPQITGL